MKNSQKQLDENSYFEIKQNNQKNDIAIIGMACRFPGARNYEEFWENLKEGRSSIQEIPPGRWDWKAYWGDPQTEVNKSKSKWGGFIEGADVFDAGFFGLSAREVETMDPQQRIMLELAWNCFEDAGICPATISGKKTGVFIGVFNFDYKELQEKNVREIETFHSTGTASTAIPNRISYYFNLKGPSFPIDTACSSSLNAIHAAAQSIYSGECEMALAGGVSLLLTPTRHISFSKTGMLSPTGSCKTFDESADGYVRSEGAGLILLKPLKNALVDKDHIYGILKGSAINHNGKTHTLTYPNPEAQAEVITAAYKRAGITPESVSYIEAHGTGTPKGDPLEFQGLIRAFKGGAAPEGKITPTRARANYCGLSSAKTNIGHLESAAGIAGVIKVLLAMKHKQLPGLSNFNRLNHRITMEESPFYIIDHLQEWPPLKDEANQSLPRRAGVSSFGFGGTNAHVLLEEAPAVLKSVNTKRPGYLICLSAKTEAALRQREQDLTLWLGKKGPQSDIADICATLLLGREHFNFRAVYVAGDIQELQGKIKEVREKGRTEGYFTGNLSQGNITFLRSHFEELGRKIINELQVGDNPGEQEYNLKLMTLAELYVNGANLDWKEMYANTRITRVNLPVYPFAGERYWIPEHDWVSIETHGRASLWKQIHPLLHQNTSTLAEQRFSSTFTGREFFLADHIVKGRRILPGVAMLEMVRAAVEASWPADMTAAAGPLEEGKFGLKLKNVVWARPIVLGKEPVQVHIRLFAEEGASIGGGAFFEGEIAYEIYSERAHECAEESSAEVIIHSQGSGVLSSYEEAPLLDLAALKAQCHQNIISASQCYEVFKAMGLEYGPGHRGIEKLYIGSGLVLAELSLPASVLDTKDQFFLHPSLMDAALQAGLLSPENWNNNARVTPLKLVLPFALSELEIFSHCVPHMWAFIQYSEGVPGGDAAPGGSANKVTDKARKLEITICDDEGMICVRMTGILLLAPEEADGQTRDVNVSQAPGMLMLEPVWKEQAVIEGTLLPRYDRHLVALCEPDAITPESIETQIEGFLPGHRCLVLQSKRKSVAERFQTYAARMFEELQRILNEKPSNNVLVQMVVFVQPEQQLFTGLFGLLKTAQLENPKLIGQLIEIEPEETAAGLAEKLMENAREGTSPSHIHNRVRYQGGKRWVADWGEVVSQAEEVDIPWKDRGIYLITGGAGGLGLIFAKEIARQTKNVTLVLTGRATLNDEKLAKLEELRLLGARVDYRQADVTQKKAVIELIQGIKEDYGSLHGIIHGAGIIRDNYIIKKTGDEIQAVLPPKVTGLVNLDQASQDLDLDFFILFSSIAGSLGNPGQADYAAANAFMDAYAGYRNNLVTQGQRHGHTLSINWPLWKEGGMQVDETTAKMLLQNMGMVPMQTAVGIRALYQTLASRQGQVMVVEGDLSLIKQKLFLQTNPAFLKPAPASTEADTVFSSTSATEEIKEVPGVEEVLLREKTLNYLKKVLSSVIKLPADRIEADAPMEKYGINSIMVMQLTSKLEETFGSLPKTLFFEYQNIRELIGYFLTSYRSRLTAILGIEEKTAAITESLKEPIIAIEHIKPINSRMRSRFTSVRVPSPEAKLTGALDIAIIGVSGRYPGARNVHEFWKLLRDGKDCIVEIPKDRWDYNLFFDEDKNKPGKTYSKWGGFLDGVDKFDPLFFNIAPREAEIMDPQERLFLECVYETLEDAGYTRQSIGEEALGSYKGLGLEGNVGVFVGVMYGEYQLYGAQEQLRDNQVALWGISSSIANRVSYFCNFHGPSMAVDTMCSSSLTAIHLACQSIQRGGCELAIAGGVNVSVHPNKYLFLAQGKFASSKGRCESFGEGGDGYVPGEGVGAVLLKPLSKAIADRDQIYGIIKGATVNHGGKTNGYTVPNLKAQAEVIGQTFRSTGINPRTISYIEAHGTGTSLGDPIEIAGLTKAFREYTGDKQFCAIGSAKSNIGHCESAAGIAGVTKVLLQLKNKQLAPSLHSETLNPNIDFVNTPFVVQQELTEWKRPMVEIDGNVREYPRIAGISSFGAGGSNAHVVIEEYIPEVQEQPWVTTTSQGPAAQARSIIVLSGKNEARLKEQAQRLLVTIQEQEFSELNIADIAYTLQVGREAMEERLGLIVSSLKELEEKLKEFIEGGDGIPDLYRGQVKRDQETYTVFTVDEDLGKAIDTWINKGKYAKLLELWVKGLSFDWNKLYGNLKPRRMSLPTYPFAEERYWVPVETHDRASLRERIHPLLHQNTSTFTEQRFSSTFTGGEFFLTDHRVKGQRVLPGVAMLEMVRAAVESSWPAAMTASAGPLEEGKFGIKLKNVIWARPIVLGNKPIQVHIALFAEEGASTGGGASVGGDAFFEGVIAYEIYSEPEEGGAEVIVHSQGSVVLSAYEKAPVMDLAALRAQCHQNIISSSQCYEVFKAMGLEYGPGHQGLEKLYMGSDLALAELSLPASVFDAKDQFGLHPSLMDAALQASLGLMMSPDHWNNSSAPLKPALPFALQELKILGNCAPHMWALVRYSAGESGGRAAHERDVKVTGMMPKLDIDICDDQGTICVRMKGLSSRVLEGELGAYTRESNSPPVLGTLMLEPVWNEQAVIEDAPSARYERQLVILCEPGATTPESIETQTKGSLPECRFLVLQSKRKNIEERFQTYAAQIFEEIQRILNERPKNNVLVQMVVFTQPEQQLFTGLFGLLKTAGLENPRLIGQLIEIGRDENAAGLVGKLRENARACTSCSPSSNHIRYRDGKRFVSGWSEVENSLKETARMGGIPWKDRGVYLITGGAGGLGVIFATEIARQAKDVTLVLTGRATLNDEKSAKLEALRSSGARIEYRQVDVTQKKIVEQLILHIRENYGSLDGIIHGAGITRDNYIIKKTREELQAVLLPKVTGLVNLDHASQDLALDFFILFSSIAGCLGNPGQADYSAANSFMDAYAKYRNNLVALKQRQGLSLSINWPLWRDGGMRVDETVEKMMMQNLGMTAMETSTGIQALYQSVASGKAQIMVMEGKLTRMKEKILSLTVPPTAAQFKDVLAPSVSTTMVDTGGLLDKLLSALKLKISKILKVRTEDIDSHTELREYGFDSILLTQFANELNEEYKLELTPVIFFEHPTLKSLAEYLAGEYQAVFAARFALQTTVSVPKEEVVENGLDAPPILSRRARFSKIAVLTESKQASNTLEPVAVIGMSGIFPSAGDLNEFWNNLLEGKDCITEIPKNRWDWREYYGDPAKEPNKTNIKWGGFIEGVDEFDPLFFGISPKEAELMDPQQRLLMTYVWKAIEDAGYAAQSLSGTNTAIFVGTGNSGYSGLISQSNMVIEGYTSTGAVPSVGPNRMSYFLNLHGPSEPIETACSSSLVAIHRAVCAMANGGCEMAIVGGVNTIVTPEFHISFNKAGMLSEDGRCKTFSDQANGYARGEGAGMIFLKKLTAAERDGDHIYGVIRGTVENHGGRANSLTAPNPKAQTELLVTAYTKAGIDPRTVTYIEAHGTGTKLGDPIEINGLKTAFKELYEATGDPQVAKSHCGLGSVKTNIGHLEFAAGIAGVIKVLLQLKHKTLIKSLYCDTINPYIELKDSPFYIVRDNEEWQAIQDANGRELPRRAGVSSFGFGGVNAHVVLEEYIPKDQERLNNTFTTQHPAIIVLSAKNEDRLKEQARQLFKVIEERRFTENSLADIAYTLQVGRETLEERLALLAGSMKELEEKLKGFVVGEEGISDLYRGQVKPNKETLTGLAVDEDMEKTVYAWINKGKYGKLLDLWVNGFSFDWNKLYGEIKPRRISLPTYPFAKESYWIPERYWVTEHGFVPGVHGAHVETHGRASLRDYREPIHPLLHQNTSTLAGQRFSSTFTGREFFLTDHVVQGQMILPGVAYLEMVRAAVEASQLTAMTAAARPLVQDQFGLQLKNVVWVRPIVVGDQPVRVNIGLFPEDSASFGVGDEISYEIYSEPEDNDENAIIYSQGSAVLGSFEKAPVLDLNVLKSQCNLDVISSSQCYEVFRAMGFLYGPGHQGIDKLYIGSGQVLAELSLPSSVSNTKDQFFLHPSLMDAAFQAGLMMSPDNWHNSKTAIRPALPFALHGLEIHGICTPHMWALIRYSEGNKFTDTTQKLDIDIYDDQGKLCVRIKGISLRIFEGEVGERLQGTLMIEPVRKDKSPASTVGDKKVPAVGEDLLREKALNYLKKLISSVIKLPADRIGADTPMEKYGIDSVMVLQLTNQLEEIFGSLPKTLFFEYQNLQEFTGYFLTSYRDQLIAILGIEEKTAATADNLKDNVTATIPVKPINSHRGPRFTSYVESLRDKVTGALDIAIIGVAGRYPGAANTGEFWRNLRDGKDCITEIPEERWDHSLYFDEDKNKPGKTYSKWGGFLDGVDRFDPLFFNISPREAEMMDPQERLFLECVYETLEDAGYTRETLSLYKESGLEGNVGVFVGVMYEEYQLYGAQEQLLGRPLALTGNPASIANRVSYFCNFHGPSMAIDTMCSSSLTAIHLACQSLHRGGCELAVAGGVNVSIHPNKYLVLGQGKFVSSKGRCESFGEGGDGYVPGEGVGAVLLKPLAKAIADGDHVYGVIKATAINHGGKTNGYTVPNPNVQAAVIGQALKEGGIDPRAISYIEAHGTGTSLGDPVEIAGLTKAFREYTEDKQFCAIGSAKSNIGHCESAAGIAGVTKVLLQLKHGQLAPSLHSKTLNPHIDFSNTPFIVQQELAEWKRPLVGINGNVREIPRIAGISSFGAGGSNAHVVIEEFISKVQDMVTPCNPTAQARAVIVLSAKNEARLKEQARRLLVTIQEQEFTNLNLATIAYTLQVGREAMEERLGLIVSSIKELEEKLNGFIEGHDGMDDLYRGQLKRNQETYTIFTADEDLRKAIDAWISKGKYAKILELWVKGLSFDWNKLYNEIKPRRISLPAYPFAGERYWAPMVSGEIMRAAETHGRASLWKSIHPLLHQNTSDLSEQRFSSTFTGQEFFLTDHVVQERRVLPGVAYLEMARAAVEHAAGVLAEEQTEIRLKNVVWTRPVIVGTEPVRVNIRIFPGDNGEIVYEILSKPENGSHTNIEAESILYSQGSAVFSAIEKIPPLDLKALQAECNQSSLSSVECYELFKTLGLDYGPGHQGLEKVYVGNGQVLAKLTLPVSVFETKDQFILHPSLMDAALQASLGLMINTGELKLSLPFALQELQIISKTASTMWALIRNSIDNTTTDKIQKFDIDLCDGQGNVCIRMKGFSSRLIDDELGSFEASSRMDLGTLMLEPVWKEQVITEGVPVPDYSRYLLVLCEPEHISLESVATQMKGVGREFRGLILQSDEKNMDERFQKYAVELFEEIKNILNEKPQENVLIQMVIFTHPEKQLFTGLLGLLKTAQMENPKLISQLIEIETAENLTGIIQKLRENARACASCSPTTNHIRYQNGKRFVFGFREMENSLEKATIPWRNQGVYLITGGVGGLGLIFAKEIARRAQEVTLILTGRSKLNEEKQSKLEELKALGARVEYKQVDVTQMTMVTELVQSILKEYGSLHGVIHGAGVIHDNYILKKDKEEFQAVLMPKVTGLVNLDQATKDLNLDYFVLFSSLAGSIGNPGQVDYATANAFMDAYAGYRNNLVASNERHGHTQSINWPLWKEGGMRVDEAVEKMMLQNTGMVPMKTQTGIEAFYQGIASGKTRVMVMEGKITRMKQKILSEMTPQSAPHKEAAAAPDSPAKLDAGSLQDKVQEALMKIVSEILKINIEDIDLYTPLIEYGFDSVLLTEFANNLNKEYKLGLTTVEFFEHPTLYSLAEYLIQEHQARFNVKFEENTRVETPANSIAGQNKEDKDESFSQKGRHSRFI